MKKLTVNQLHQILSKLVYQGKGRMPVAVNKETFSHNCETDGVVILEAYQGEVTSVLMSDDDGGTKFNKDGTESYRTMFVLTGNTCSKDNKPS